MLKTQIIRIKSVEIGGDNIAVIAGPCAIESELQFLKSALAVKKAGANILRGGAYKPRTSPHEFQGLKEKGLEILHKVGSKLRMPVVTEIVDPRDIEIVYKNTDIFQVGTRNMQNFALLTELGKLDKPVILKRGMSSTINEWIHASKYITIGGNKNVILCERGIRTFEDSTRNTLALDTIPLLKELTKLPIIIDPSHATGTATLVPAMCKASIAAGAHGVMVDVHIKPKQALCDADQALTPKEFETMMKELSIITSSVGKNLANSKLRYKFIKI